MVKSRMAHAIRLLYILLSNRQFTCFEFWPIFSLHAGTPAHGTAELRAWLDQVLENVQSLALLAIINNHSARALHYSCRVTLSIQLAETSHLTQLHLLRHRNLQPKTQVIHIETNLCTHSEWILHSQGTGNKLVSRQNVLYVAILFPKRRWCIR